MIYLDPSSPKTLKAKNEFLVEMRDFVFNRINRYQSGDGPLPRNIVLTDILLHELIFNHVDEILVGLPDRLVALNNKINPFIRSSKDLKSAVEYIFNYDSFCAKTKRYDSYSLASALDTPTCTYCNINYTNTIINKNKKKITRPQFDHFFDKANNPLLAISFFNLIPSCAICNSIIKKSVIMYLNVHLHPYIDNGLNEIKFSYKYSNHVPNGVRVKVVTPGGSKSEATAKVFALEEIYNAHTGLLQEILRTKECFSDKYLEILSSNLLEGVVASKEELYRIVFGTEYDQENFVKRPFSKFKSDILKEIGIIS